MKNKKIAILLCIVGWVLLELVNCGHPGKLYLPHASKGAPE